VVSAPFEIVWSLLTDPARWGDFFDVRITRVEPAGSAVVGQRFYGESGPRFLHIGLKFEYTKVNVAKHKLGLNAIGAFLVLATPLNIYSAIHRVRFGGHSSGPWYLAIRLPLQMLLFVWTYCFTLR
jgi:hypothetical protein